MTSPQVLMFSTSSTSEPRSRCSGTFSFSFHHHAITALPVEERGGWPMGGLLGQMGWPQSPMATQLGTKLGSRLVGRRILRPASQSHCSHCRAQRAAMGLAQKGPETGAPMRTDSRTGLQDPCIVQGVMGGVQRNRTHPVGASM